MSLDLRQLRRWLRPPRHLLVVLLAISLVSASALGWLGYKLIEQSRVVEAQRVQERLDQAADGLAAGLRGRLAELGESFSARLAGGAGPPHGLEGGPVLTFTSQGVEAFPKGRLRYYPVAAAPAEAPASTFAEGEELEFRRGDLAAAETFFRRLAGAKAPAVRAGGLLRLGRVLRKAERQAAALAAYEELARLGGTPIAGAPAELLARQARCDLFDAAARTAELRRESEALRGDLRTGRWRLTRGQYQFYAAEAARMLGEKQTGEKDLFWSEAATAAWDEWQRRPGASPALLWAAGRPFVALWRGAPDRRAALLIEPEDLLRRIAPRQDLLYALTDAEGRLLAGTLPQASRRVTQTSAESRLPWTLHVAAPASQADSRFPGGRLLLLALALIVAFVLAGTYFIARVIRREAAVARLQSDFVSAVSHEFRSPLSSIRHLSEVLAAGRVPGEERRHQFYDMLVRESRRLQRLVETLLNFGRMEAGARPYRFESLEAGELVRNVIAEIEPQVSPEGRHIELSGQAGAARVQADPEALSLAVRNLIDNALKYSPSCPTVWVQWGTEGERVTISVKDRGLGIPASERKAIFERFVRGEAATAAQVRGTGVGLAIVRHVVAAHGGEIRLESEPDQGSTFTILLPVSELTQ